MHKDSSTRKIEMLILGLNLLRTETIHDDDYYHDDDDDDEL